MRKQLTRGQLPSASFGEAQSSLEHLEREVLATNRVLERAGLGATHTATLLRQTGEHLDQLLAELDQLGAPAELFEKAFTSDSVLVGSTHNDGG